MPLRQVQAHEAPRGRVREVRRRGDPGEGPPRAHGPHRSLATPVAHIWFLTVAAEPYRLPARHPAQRSRDGPLLRGVHRHRPEARRADLDSARSCPRSAYSKLLDELGYDAFDAGMGAEAMRELLRRPRHRRARRDAARGDARGRPARPSARSSPSASRSWRPSESAATSPEWMMLDGHPRDPARSAPARSAGGRPLRDVRPERPLPPRHQPQQPPATPPGAEGAGGHHPQREAHAAGGCRRSVRQRPPRP